jgi:DNA-binding MarR family transcriptional regulator
MIVSDETIASRAPPPMRTILDHATAERLDLERFVPYRLSVLANRVSHALGCAYHARFGLTIPEWRVMAVLGRYAPASATELGWRTSMDKVKVSRAIAALVARGLVDRATDPADQRMIELRLSAAGRAMHAAIAELALGFERELLSVLDAEERALLDTLLERLHRQVLRQGGEPDEALSGD